MSPRSKPNAQPPKAVAASIGCPGEASSQTTRTISSPLANAGVPGFKCFLIHPGIDGFTMVTESQLRAALPHIARTGLPLLVHAELPAPIDSATANLANADWSLYETYLQSRPEEAELSAIRMLLVSLPRIQIPPAHRPSLRQRSSSRTARRSLRRPSRNRRNLPPLSAFHL